MRVLLVLVAILLSAAAAAANGWLFLAEILPKLFPLTDGWQMWLGVQIGVAMLNFTIYLIVAAYLKRTGGEEWKQSLLRNFLADIGGMLAIASFLPIVLAVFVVVADKSLHQMARQLQENLGTHPPHVP